MTSYVDTDVLIELIRGNPASGAWLDSVNPDEVELPGIVVMELVAGCRNAEELRECRTLIAPYALAWPDQTECNLALDLLSTHRLRDGIGIPDCLIAAMAVHRQAKLYSFNIRHFRAVPGLDCVQPYERK